MKIVRSGNTQIMAFGLAMTLAWTGIAVCQDQKSKTELQDNDKSVRIESKLQKAAPLPDFVTALELPFDSIGSIGTRIKAARSGFDPVSLAILATELDVAEKVSGKKAAITASSLFAESVKLAKMRRQERELQAIALLVKDPAVADELKALASKAKIEEKERLARFESGEREKAFRFLVVVNRCPATLIISVNGFVVGKVFAHSEARFATPMANTPIVDVYAEDPVNGVWFANQQVGYVFESTWFIDP